MQPVLIPQTPIRRALAISAVVHAVIVAVAWSQCNPAERQQVETVDIEMAPAPPPVEALPEEVAKAPTEELAGKKELDKAVDDKSVPESGDYAIDAGIDAPIDAPPDARPDARPDAPPPDARPDAPPDAEPMLVQVDAGVEPDATEVAVVDAADAPQVATLDPWGAGSGEDPCNAGSGSGAAGSGSNAGSASVGSGSGSGGVAEQSGSGSGSAGTTNDPAVNGAPTTAGTAANLLAYFPKGHMVTALIRFDRLRGTEWAAHTERLLRPMPDYRLLFGPKEAKIYEKLDMLAISTPSPRDAAATTLVGRTRLGRGALRDFLGATTPIAWSTSKGGLFGRRTGRVFPGDKRVFLSPFRSWFLLGQPGDLGGLTQPAAGNVDTIEATGPLPPWLGQIRKIESETGDPRGPALVVTLSADGSKLSTGPFEGPLGIKEVQLPERISLAMELVPQGWLVRGNIRFKTEAQAADFAAQLTTVKQRLVGAALLLEQAIGKEPIRVIKNFQFARTGARISYTTSISIADTRALLAVAAQYLDSYYRAPPP